MSIRRDILKKYRQVDLADLQGKKIIHDRSNNLEIVIIVEGNWYVKMSTTCNRDGGPELEEASLTVRDLWLMGVIPQSDWTACQDESSAKRQANQETADILRFKLAAAQIGLGIKPWRNFSPPINAGSNLSPLNTRGYHER
jgi:hypothetical protein